MRAAARTTRLVAGALLVVSSFAASACDSPTERAGAASGTLPSSAPLPAPFGPSPTAEERASATSRGSATVRSEPSPEPARSGGAASDGAAAPHAASAPQEAVAPSALAGDELAPTKPVLHDAAGKLLPQTEDKPSIESPLFKRRVESLVRAIEKDDVELARSFFFPLEAYEVVKAIKEPTKDWNRRLFRAFTRNIHEYHRKLGKHAEGTKLVRFDVDERRAKWMKRATEVNNVGYFRLTRSRLILEDGAGKKHDFELTSMISWRGEWYVVHLHGFK